MSISAVRTGEHLIFGKLQKKNIASVLVFSVTLSVYLLLLLGYKSSQMIPDEEKRMCAGITYIRGLLSGDPTAFYVHPQHPPLAKLITGMITLLLEPVGLGHYPVPPRLHFSLVVAILGMLAYNVGLHVDGQTTGLLFWLLFLPIPFASSINYYSTLDVTSLLFLCLGFYFLLVEKRKWIGGIFYGLASLSKYVPLPLFPIVTLSWNLYDGVDRKTVANMFQSFLVGLAIVFVGNPLLWNLESLQLMMGTLSIHQQSSTIWTSPLLHFMEGRKEVVFEIVALLFYLISYPSEKFLGLNLFIPFIVILYWSVLKRHRLSRFQVFLLLWTSTLYLFHAVHRIRMWYHDIWVLVPAYLLIASLLSKILKHAMTNFHRIRVRS